MKTTNISCKPNPVLAVLSAVFFLLFLSMGLTGCGILPGQDQTVLESGPSLSDPAPETSAGISGLCPIYHSEASAVLDLSQIPPWSGDPWVRINGNRPFFTEKEITALFSEEEAAARLTVRSFEEYGELDALGRCTGAFACAGTDLMPESGRESIAEIRPTGWHIVKYAGIDGNFLYNRCHLIAYGLTAENANERNLITGTRYMNTAGMNDFENETIAYIRRTGRHVLYRVTPVFQGDDLVVSGVLMEGLSVEDSGLAGHAAEFSPGQTKPGICFCIYAYNVQPGVTINYATEESTGPLFTGTENVDHSIPRQENSSGAGFIEPGADITYVINIYSGKFHRPDCTSVREMNQHNRRDVTDTRKELIEKGFDPCGKCRP